MQIWHTIPQEHIPSTDSTVFSKNIHSARMDERVRIQNDLSSQKLADFGESQPPNESLLRCSYRTRQSWSFFAIRVGMRVFSDFLKLNLRPKLLFCRIASDQLLSGELASLHFASRLFEAWLRRRSLSSRRFTNLRHPAAYPLYCGDKARQCGAYGLKSPQVVGD